MDDGCVGKVGGGVGLVNMGVGLLLRLGDFGMLWLLYGLFEGMTSLILAQQPVGLRGLFPYAAILRVRKTASRCDQTLKEPSGNFAVVAGDRSLINVGKEC